MATVELDGEQIAVVSLVRYPKWYSGETRSIGDTDKIRGDLALKSISAGVERGYHMVIANSDSSSDFEAELARFPELTLIRRQEQVRAPGRRAGIMAASAINGVEAILTIEPEKAPIIEEFVPQLVGPILNGTAELVVGKRNPELFRQSYPDYMWQSEVAANAKYNYLLHKAGLLPPGQELDIFFGPIAFLNKPDVVQVFLEKYQFTQAQVGVRKYFNPEDYSDARYFPAVDALNRGIRVASVVVDFQYPVLQKKNEESAASGSLEKFARKRKVESQVFVGELIHLLRFLQGDSKSGLQKIE